MSSDFRAAASDLASRYGLHVFPIAPGRKTPLTKRGCLDASDCQRTIARWADRWPTANVGVACGANSGVCVIDIDCKGGAPGYQTMTALAAAGKRLPPRPIVRTPSGGLHLWFKHVLNLKNAAGVTKSGRGIGPGVDFRSNGGYVVVPPSTLIDCDAHGAGDYEWLKPICDFVDLPDLPAWAIAMLREPWRPRPKFQPLRTDDIAMRKLEALARTVAQASAGNRNSVLYWAARRAIEAGLPRETVEDRLTAAALAAGPIVRARSRVLPRPSPPLRQRTSPGFEYFWGSKTCVSLSDLS